MRRLDCAFGFAGGKEIYRSELKTVQSGVKPPQSKDGLIRPSKKEESEFITILGVLIIVADKLIARVFIPKVAVPLQSPLLGGLSYGFMILLALVLLALSVTLLIKLRQLRMRGSQIKAMPSEVISEMDSAIEILANSIATQKLAAVFGPEKLDNAIMA